MPPGLRPLGGGGMGDGRLGGGVGGVEGLSRGLLPDRGGVHAGARGSEQILLLVF